MRLFEKNFKDYHKDFEALAVSNGTVALHLALEALGVKKGYNCSQSNFCSFN